MSVENTPSRTSQAVALVRAGLERPVSAAGDESAQRQMTSLMTPLETETESGLRPSLAARTHFFDRQVLLALAREFGQVVVLGAGYDDRALRFRSEGVRFFELDHPATQSDKRELLLEISPGVGPVLVPADFRADDIARLLATAGHDDTSRTLFLCEGLLVYLDGATILRLLRALRERAAPGSILAASLAIHPRGLSSAYVLDVANSRRKTADAEPWRTILPAEEHLELLSRGGWRLSSAIDAATLDQEMDEGRSLLVTAEPQ